MHYLHLVANDGCIDSRQQTLDSVKDIQIVENRPTSNTQRAVYAGKARQWNGKG
jgi:hypothetical protein